MRVRGGKRKTTREWRGTFLATAKTQQQCHFQFEACSLIMRGRRCSLRALPPAEGSRTLAREGHPPPPPACDVTSIPGDGVDVVLVTQFLRNHLSARKPHFSFSSSFLFFMVQTLFCQKYPSHNSFISTKSAFQLKKSERNQSNCNLYQPSQLISVTAHYLPSAPAGSF